MRNGIFVNPHYETYTLELIQKSSNTFEYESPKIKFKGRPANHTETKAYRITKGVEGSNDSVMIMCSNLPNIAEIGDKIKYLDKIWTISSIGYYIDQNKFVNGGIFSSDYIESRCPKGITLS